MKFPAFLKYLTKLTALTCAKPMCNLCVNNFTVKFSAFLKYLTNTSVQKLTGKQTSFQPLFANPKKLTGTQPLFNNRFQYARGATTLQQFCFKLHDGMQSLFKYFL